MASVTPRRNRDGSVFTATVARVGNPKRVLTDEDAAAIRAAMDEAERVRASAEDKIRAAVITAHAHGASFRVLSEFTGRSTSTITAWNKAARES